MRPGRRSGVHVDGDAGHPGQPAVGEDQRQRVVARRLEQRGWIEGEWGPSENNRRARYYKLTRTGHAQLVEEKRNWYRLTSAMNWMLESEG